MSRKAKLLNLKALFSYAILCLSALWALAQSCRELTCQRWTSSNISFSLIAFQAAFGCWKFRSTTELPKFYNVVTFLTHVNFVSLVCIDLYRFRDMATPWAFVHLIYPVFAFWDFHMKKKKCESKKIQLKVVDVVNFISVCSFIFVCARTQNQQGIVASVACTMVHLLKSSYGKNMTLFGYKLSKPDVTNFLTAVFVLFGVQALISEATYFGTINWVAQISFCI